MGGWIRLPEMSNFCCLPGRDILVSLNCSITSDAANPLKRQRVSNDAVPQFDRAGKLRYITMMPEVLEDRDVQNFRGRL